MNPLDTRGGTVMAGILLAVFFVFLLGPKGAFNPWEFWVWFHVVSGIAWVGLLYYFNFVQIPAVNQALADKEPGPAAINKYIVPRALFWFRWAAIATWLTGCLALEALHSAPGSGVMAAFGFKSGFEVIGMGAWLGTIMLFNVWVLIWPNQKKLLGMTPATDEQKATAKRIAFLASRTNSMLSIPMLLGMTGFTHGLPF